MSTWQMNINDRDITKNEKCPVCKIRLNMPPRYCSKVCEDSAMAGFERDRERWER